MRCNVADNSTEVLAIEEPLWSSLRIDSMWTESGCLQYLANRARLNQLASTHRCFVLEAFAVHDRINSIRCFLYATHFGELCKRSDAGFVRHVIFAMLHHRNSQRRAVGGNAGAEHELDRIVFEYLFLTTSLLHLRITLGKSRSKVGFFGIERNEFTTAANRRSDLTVNVIVVNSDDRKSKPWLLMHTSVPSATD